MPKTDVHIEASVKKTGKSHQAVQAFVDFEKKKPERHDVTKMVDYTRLIESKYGVDVELLRKAGVSEDDIEHCLAVAAKALEIAHRTGAALDFELIGRGALFHDLGKSKTHAIEHGKLGAEMGQKLGLPAAITDIMEKHIRGGLTEAEAIELGLPVKDYRLNKIEEKIVIYADRLVDIIMDGVVKTDEEAEQRFEEILTTQIKYGKNDITLKRYLGYHREIQALMGNS